MKHFKILLILSLIIIAVIAIAIWYLTALNATTITSSELNSTGNCTIANNKTSLTNNESTILCKAGESFEGFKLLKVNSFSIQILIYDDCSACMHDATNSNSFVKIINVTVGQSFGGGCGGIYYPSKLMATNVENKTSIFEFNMSETTVCM